MAIIYSYPYDTNIQDNDAWIGTNDGVGRKTKQFTVGAVANYLNTAGKVSISGQMNYKFVNGGNTPGTISFVLGNYGGPFTAITSFRISIVDLGGANVVNFLSYLIGTGILVSHQNDPSSFGHYEIIDYQPTANQDFYILTLNNIGGSGSIVENNYYDVSALLIKNGAGFDKNFVYTQAVPSSQWNINHTLNKFASVSVVDTAGTQVYGDVTYDSYSSITLNFSSAFAGKAFLN